MKKCVVCGRECNKLKRNMCEKHYKQYKKYGKVLDNNPRTKKDSNEIILHEDYAEIVLYDNQCEEIARALIDLDDVERVENYKWHLLKNNGYVCNTTKNYLHRFVMNCPDNMVVDHINHNKLDNRKSSLRVCEQKQNSLNKRKQSNNSSNIVGVLFDKKRNKWLAYITYNHKTRYLGRFDTKEEAAEVRKQAEIEYFGEYRNQDNEDVS